jgi:TusA-related sulfurtransferase
MKSSLHIISFLIFALMVFQSCEEAPKSNAGKSEEIKKKSLNPNGDSELALLMRDMFAEAKQIKKQIQNGEEVTVKVDHERILSAHATQPAKAASAEYKTWGAAYLAGVESLKNATPETAEAAYTSLVNSCMNCHQALCPGPVVKIKKLQMPT